jgi:hypothetical protein
MHQELVLPAAEALAAEIMDRDQREPGYATAVATALAVELDMKVNGKCEPVPARDTVAVVDIESLIA